jgi:hypothetical protein
LVSPILYHRKGDRARIMRKPAAGPVEKPDFLFCMVFLGLADGAGILILVNEVIFG